MSWIDLLDLIQSVFDGVMFGATYALIGIGFTLIFGVMHKINLSYAAASVGAAYLSLLVVQVAPTPLVYLAAALLGGVLGALVYLVCFRFLPLDQPLATLMSTVGMLLVLEEAIVHVTAGMPQNYPALFSGVVFDVGPFMLRGDLMFVFKLMLEKTRLGLATRAVAQQSVAARLCGMSVSTTNATTFVIAGFLGGTAGAMTGAAIGVLSPLLTLPLTVKGLVVTVIGGLGSIPGAILAGLVVGGVENFFQFIRGVSERDIYVMLMLFVFLVFRPGGLFAAPGGRD
jgi:branched-subunit amino acid ABC-type transport system permease component